MNKHEKKRPISRTFWKFLKYVPAPIRARYIRSQFEVDTSLPADLIFKQAETEQEIQQALKIVHDSYVELNYIDPVESQLRFSKFHALPTTVILVAKIGDEVIGTLTIIPDSALGLPADITWPLEKYRKNGKIIAEISSLAIKKDFRMRRGKLLMPLCKIMYLYCTEVLRLDGIVIATTIEVEPFYTDVLLFQKVVATTGQAHKLVKGNPSSCCYLELDEQLVQSYKKIYSHKSQPKNLYNFFLQSDTPNIHLPDKKHCIQSYMQKKNFSQAKLLQQHQSLTQDFTASEKLIIQNLDITTSAFEQIPSPQNSDELLRAHPRAEIRSPAWCFFEKDRRPQPCRIIDVSRTGFKMLIQGNQTLLSKGDTFVLVLDFNGKLIQCKAELKWVHSQTKMGCFILESSPGWDHLIEQILAEVNLQVQVIAPSFRKTA